MSKHSSHEEWYALQVRTRFARPTATALREKGYEVFLPMYAQRRRWSDRLKTIEYALFPGYLFCQFDPSDRLLPILTTAGVMSIVCAGKTPIPVPDYEIDAIKTIVRSGLQAVPYPQIPCGTRVLIEKGPLTGVEGIAVTVDKAYKLIVSVEMLQRSVMVHIDRDWARPIEKTLVPRVPSTSVSAARLAAIA